MPVIQVNDSTHQQQNQNKIKKLKAVFIKISDVCKYRRQMSCFV
jgi:hypothetical protein